MKEQINKISEAEDIMRQRIDELSKKDIKNENSTYDIASKEDEFRKNLKSKGIGGNVADQLADVYSDEVLEKFEAIKMSWTDKLTGLRNRNALSEETPQLLSMEKRQNKDCSLLMIDFDYFKKVNDELGHQAGDQVLKSIAQIIKNQVRTADIVYRYGGEEIAVFLPDTVSSKAAELAERIRAVVEKSEIELVDAKSQKQHIKKTISIGCVGTDQLKEWGHYKEKEAGDFLKIVIENADKALNHAKQTGRNKLTVYSEDLKEFAAQKI